jgi:hypothetical protein
MLHGTFGSRDFIMGIGKRGLVDQQQFKEVIAGFICIMNQPGLLIMMQFFALCFLKLF